MSTAIVKSDLGQLPAAMADLFKGAAASAATSRKASWKASPRSATAARCGASARAARRPIMSTQTETPFSRSSSSWLRRTPSLQGLSTSAAFEEGIHRQAGLLERGRHQA